MAISGDSSYEFYPPSASPADCGTFLATGGQLYAPDFANHAATATNSLGAYVPFTQMSQTGVTGTGAQADPFQVITEVGVGSTGLTLTQTDTYVVGADHFNTSVVITNTAAASQGAILYRAGDCYLADADSGFGLYDSAKGAVGCQDSTGTRNEEWIPGTPGSSYVETFYNTLWADIGSQQGLPDSCDCNVNEDNSAGLSWNITVPSGQSVTISGETAFNTPGYYDQLVHQQGAIAYWPMDETSGATIAHNEMSSNGTNDGLIDTSQGTATLGVVGRGPTESSYLLNHGYVTVPNPSGMSTPQFSVAGWVRIPNSATPVNGYLFYNGSNQRDGYGLGVFNGTPSGFACVAGGTCAGVAAPASRVADHSWHQLVLTMDGSTLTLYVDGLPVASHALAGNVAYLGGDQVDIGRRGITNDNFLVAGVDDVSVYDHALPAADVAAQWPAGACPQSTVSDLMSGPQPPAGTLPNVPLSASGRYIVDNNGQPFKLTSVNWYGFEQLTYAPAGLQCQPLSSIVQEIVQLGVKSVRLPWATDSWMSNPVVPDVAVAANPGLRGLHLHKLMDAVINELARQGIMTILDNHTTTADWCCSNNNALWWEGNSPANWHTLSPQEKQALYHRGQRAWLRAWRNIVTRYSPGGIDPQSAVVGADLRNEPRADNTAQITAVWGGNGTLDYENWKKAATRAGDTILSVNPNLLIMVEGVNFGTMLGGYDDPRELPANPSTNLTGVAGYPIMLTMPSGAACSGNCKLVYSPHNYSFSPGGIPADQLATKLGQWWGYLLQNGTSYSAAPIWLGEFGTCNYNDTNCLQTTDQGSWWQAITSYIGQNGLSWSYWALNGTGAEAAAEPAICGPNNDGERFLGCTETYGLLNTAWQTEASPALTQTLGTIEGP